MEEDKIKIKKFTDLNAWKFGHEIVLETYKITKMFPKSELFVLVSQMRRCSISITSNIAEGFSRQSFKEKIRFYSVALGSATELQNQYIVSRDIGYIDNKIFIETDKKLLVLHKVINGLIRKSKSILHNSNL